MIIGYADGHSVHYDELTDTVTCKHITVEAQRLIDGYNSDLDRNSLGNGVVLRRNETGYTMGCLQIETSIGKQLINQIKNVRKNKQQQSANRIQWSGSADERLRLYAEA